MSPDRRRRPPTLAILTAAVIAVPLLSAPAFAAPAGGGDAPLVDTLPAPGPGQETVVLITGDRVLLDTAPGGPTVAVVEPDDRADGTDPAFEVVDEGDALYVIPDDAAPLIPDRLDRELFNVAKLADYGYDDGVPVVVTDAPRTLAATASTGLTSVTTLTSVDGYAATVTPGGDWWTGVEQSGDGLSTLTAGEPQKIWLDELAEITLDESVGMIGAPEAWAAGYDGTGVTVAVLDTGIDATHPDIAGQIIAERNFTTEPSITDGHGHGTHVAGTIAGTGAGSAGRYTGVAPGADLVIGKICTSAGRCPTSGTIAAMEWAAPIADIVNMSIGTSVPDDGTAPTSVAVNTLTAAYDTLFVVAAGNNGRSGDMTVGAPGSADAALTVGAVDKQGDLASFSSTGPRTGDHALKPDITAPGVDIVAPRAAGTSMGTPVDELYTEASGTSMATPHVAGAAALALQASPDLGAAELKADLVTTAAPNPDLTVYEQGGGLVDVPAAIDAAAIGTPAPLNLGFFPFPQTDVQPVTSTVTYTNSTDTAVDLTLDLAANATATGEAVPGTVLTVEPAVLAVPAGASATATVTLDPAGLALGGYGGALTATPATGAAVHVPVGFYLEEERYELTIHGIARDGRPADKSSSLYIADSYDTSKVRENRYFENGVATITVPPGDYFVGGSIYTYDGHDQMRQDRTFVGEPTVTVTEDTTITFDAREASEITTETPDHPGSSPFGNQARNHVRFIAEDNGTYGVVYLGPWLRTYSLASGEVRVGDFELVNGPRMTAPHLALSVTSPVERDIFARRLSGPPPLDAELNMTLIAAGDGSEGAYTGLDATGKAVLTTRDGPSLAEKEAVARAHGASALLVMNDVDGWFAGSVGDDATLPSIAIAGEEGRNLLDRLAAGPVTVRLAGTPNSPYMYDLVHHHPDAFPDGGAYVDEIDDLATVHNAFHGVPGTEMSGYRAMWRPGEIVGATLYTPVPAASERVEYITADDSLYRQRIRAIAGGAGTQERDVVYRPGDEAERAWFKSPMRTGLYERYGDRNPGQPVIRTGNTIQFVTPEWWDNCVPAGYGAADLDTDEVVFRAYQNGELFGTAPRPSVRATVGPEMAEYRFEVDVSRTASWWPTSTAVHTAWTFDSARPETDGPMLLPLLQATYDVNVDLTNTAVPGPVPWVPTTFDMHVAHQNGVDGPKIAGARLWVSYDDGVTWERQLVVKRGDGDFTALMFGPRGDTTGYASIKVEAWDADGNRLDQTVTRAWKLAEG